MRSDRSKLALAAAALAALAVSPGTSSATPPVVTTWRINTTGLTGYNGLPADVQRVRYSSTNVYVDCSSIPDFSIGPWPGNPNTPANKAFTLRFPVSPAEQTGTKTSTPLGPIGSWTNGVAIFNALDAHSYNNQNIWHQNAIAVEGPSFDACLGHPAPDGTYHHHQNARCLYTNGVAQHSPILGFAFDGFPVYGPYAHANTDGTGDITRMRTSYRLRGITTRTTLPDGTALTPAQYGPAVSTTYPLGYYIEDFEYVAGLGDLDAYNGRFAATPEYPGGTYAYYVTVDATGASEYPYSIGPKYYGIVATDNITTHGHVTVGEAVTEYDPVLGVAPGAAARIALAQNQPNPARSRTRIGFTLAAPGRVTLAVFDVAGRQVMTALDEDRPAGEQFVTLDPSRLQGGVYFYRLRVGDQAERRSMLVVH